MHDTQLIVYPTFTLTKALIIYKQQHYFLIQFSQKSTFLSVIRILPTKIIDTKYIQYATIWRRILSELLRYRYIKYVYLLVLQSKYNLQALITIGLAEYIKDLINNIKIDINSLSFKIPIKHVSLYFHNFLSNVEIHYYPSILNALSIQIIKQLLFLLRQRYSIKKIMLEFKVYNNYKITLRLGPSYFLLNSEQIKNLLFENKIINAVTSKRALRDNFDKESRYLVERLHTLLTIFYFQYNGGPLSENTYLNIFYEE